MGGRGEGGGGQVCTTRSRTSSTACMVLLGVHLICFFRPFQRTCRDMLVVVGCGLLGAVLLVLSMMRMLLALRSSSRQSLQLACVCRRGVQREGSEPAGTYVELLICVPTCGHLSDPKGSLRLFSSPDNE